MKHIFLDNGMVSSMGKQIVKSDLYFVGMDNDGALL